MPAAEKYDLVSLLSVVGKIFVKLIQIKLVDYLEKGLFCLICSKIFQAFYINSKSFDNLHKFKSYLNLCQVSGFILPFLRNGCEWLWMGSLLQKYPVNVAVGQVLILRHTLFLLYMSAQLNEYICNISIYADGTPYFKCDQASDLWQQLKLASLLQSYL